MRQFTGMLCTHKLRLERVIDMQLPQSHALMTWLVERSAWMIPVRVLGEDVHAARDGHVDDLHYLGRAQARRPRRASTQAVRRALFCPVNYGPF